MALLFAGILAAGCASADPAGAPGGSSGSGGSASADPCAGSADCTVVGQADMTGDGAFETIAVVLDPRTEASEAQLRVAVGDRVESLPIALVPGVYADSPFDQDIGGGRTRHGFYTGAFALTRDDGADVVLQQFPDQGSGGQYLVATWRDGAPAWVPAPGDIGFDGTGAAQDMGVDPEVFWRTAGSHGTRTEFGCKGDGTVTEETVYAAQNDALDQNDGRTRTITDHRYRDGRWQEGETAQVPDANTEDFSFDSPPVFQCSDLTVPIG